jgi:hypothetical protein
LVTFCLLINVIEGEVEGKRGKKKKKKKKKKKT